MKKEGIVFWIEGYSGSGKSTISKKIKKYIEQKCGKIILINGDDIRKIFNLHDYSKTGRYEVFKKYLLLTKLIVRQNINVIFTVVGLNKKYNQLLKKNFKNLITILIQSDIEKIKSIGLKKTYNYKKNVVGINIKPSLVKYQITIKNDFKKSLDKLSLELIDKIIKKLNHK